MTGRLEREALRWPVKTGLLRRIRGILGLKRKAYYGKMHEIGLKNSSIFALFFGEFVYNGEILKNIAKEKESILGESRC